MESNLRELGLHPPSLNDCQTMDDVALAISAEYLTEGLASLRQIPTASVDFAWSHAVLPYVRRNEVAAMLQEMRRIQRPDGVASHSIPLKDVIGGNLNDLRFSEKVWEAPFMADSRFYTNRLRYAELLRMFCQAGFMPEVVASAAGKRLLFRNKMSRELPRCTTTMMCLVERIRCIASLTALLYFVLLQAPNRRGPD